MRSPPSSRLTTNGNATRTSRSGSAYGSTHNTPNANAMYLGQAIPGGQGGQPPPQAVPQVNSMGYLGIGTCLEKLGQALNDPESMRRTLQWKRDVNREAAKIGVFKAEVGSLLGFQAYLMMREGMVMVTLLHSTVKYFSISSVT
jgi:hypothetical protein